MLTFATLLDATRVICSVRAYEQLRKSVPSLYLLSSWPTAPRVQVWKVEITKEAGGGIGMALGVDHDAGRARVRRSCRLQHNIAWDYPVIFVKETTDCFFLRFYNLKCI